MDRVNCTFEPYNPYFSETSHLHEEISDHYITTVRPDYLEVTVNPEVIENPEVAKDREEVIETVLPNDGGKLVGKDVGLVF